MPASFGSWSAPVSGRLMALSTVTSSGFWSVTEPGFCARAKASFAMLSIGLPPIVASRKLPADCAFGAVAAPAVPPPAVAIAAKGRAAAGAAAANGTQPRRPARRPDPCGVVLSMAVMRASQVVRRGGRTGGPPHGGAPNQLADPTAPEIPVRPARRADPTLPRRCDPWPGQDAPRHT